MHVPAGAIKPRVPRPLTMTEQLGLLESKFSKPNRKASQERAATRQARSNNGWEASKLGATDWDKQALIRIEGTGAGGRKKKADGTKNRKSKG